LSIAKTGSNISDVNYWDIKIISLKENIEPVKFYENYWDYYVANSSNSPFPQEKSEVSESIDKIYSEIEYTATLPLIVMDSDMKFEIYCLILIYFLSRKTHNFTQYHLFLDHKCYATNFFSRIIIFYFIGLDAILINEVLYTFQESASEYLFIRNGQTNDRYVWSKDDLSFYYWEDNFFFCLFSRLLNVVKILLGLFMVSNITSIYIKMTIICAPVFVLIMSIFFF